MVLNKDAARTALEKYLRDPSDINRYGMKVILEAYDCAANHFVPHSGCTYCEDEQLAEIPAALKVV